MSASPQSLSLFDDIPARWVYKSNALIKARYDWTTNVHRVVMILVSQLDREQVEFGYQRVYASEVRSLAGISTHNIYAVMADVAKGLLDLKIEVRRSKNSYSGFNLFSDAHYEEGEGHLKARFNPNMREFLFELKERYTKYQLRQAMQLASPYSIRFYEMCAMMEGIGWITIPLRELRDMFKLTDKYKRWRDLRRYVIDSARDELKEKSDLYFTYTDERQGRSVVAIKLKIHRKSAERKGELAPPLEVIQEDERDAFEVWFDALSADEQEAFDAEVRRRVQAQYGDVSDRLEVFYVGTIRRQLWQNGEMVGRKAGC